MNRYDQFLAQHGMFHQRHSRHTHGYTNTRYRDLALALIAAVLVVIALSSLKGA